MLPMDVSVIQKAGLPLGLAVLQHLVLPLDVSVVQHPVLPLDVSVIQKTVLPQCLWICLFYSSLLLPLGASILQQTVLSLNVSVLQQPWLPLDMCLFYCRMFSACAASGRVCSIAAWAAPVGVSLQRSILSLYKSSPGGCRPTAAVEHIVHSCKTYTSKGSRGFCRTETSRGSLGCCRTDTSKGSTAAVGKPRPTVAQLL